MSTKRIKVYSDSNARVSAAALRSLGADSWIQHCHVEVVATSRAEAEQILAMHGCNPGYNGLSVAGKVDPEHGDTLNVYAEALRDAGLLTADVVGACYAYGAQGADRSAVADLTADGAPVVGHLVHREGPGRGRVEFVPALPPSALDELRAAVARLDAYLADSHPIGSDAAVHDDDVRLVLDAARQSLPREES